MESTSTVTLQAKFLIQNARNNNIRTAIMKITHILVENGPSMSIEQ